jgi:hypothetical protein
MILNSISTRDSELPPGHLATTGKPGLFHFMGNPWCGRSSFGMPGPLISFQSLIFPACKKCTVRSVLGGSKEV